MSSGIRAFSAIAVPDSVRETIRRTQKRCTDAGLAFRAVRPDSVHLTIQFFQSIPKDAVAEIAGVHEECAGHTPPLDLQCRGLGVFPNIKRARVLWMGLIEETGALMRLNACIHRALAELGHPVESRPFRPHLTVGRAKGRMNPKRIADLIAEIATWPETAFTAQGLTLYQSRLTPSGAVHTPLAEMNFNPDIHTPPPE